MLEGLLPSLKNNAELCCVLGAMQVAWGKAGTIARFTTVACEPIRKSMLTLYDVHLYTEDATDECNRQIVFVVSLRLLRCGACNVVHGKHDRLIRIVCLCSAVVIGRDTS